MVTIVDVKQRTSQDGNSFIALIVQSEIQMVTSANGNIYATARKASVPSTMESLEIARMLIGKELPGGIEKVECAPYETANADGELVTLNHRYTYIPEENRTPVPEKMEIRLEEVGELV